LMAGVVLAVVTANVLLWPKVGLRRSNSRARLSVLIPARNEEQTLPSCLEAVLAQDGVAEVLVYDDHSVDGTAAVAARYARRDARVRLISPSPLPRDWCGKPFACQRLAEEATGDWLLFLDADVRVTPGSLGAVLQEAEERRVTLLSCWPGLDMHGFWERVLMPLLNFVVLTLYPVPLALRRNDASLGLAHGALMLAHRDAYRRVGGHAVVKGELFEDTALARAWRERGEVSLCLDGQQVVRTRMYRSLREIWHGFQKNFYPAFPRPLSFWAFLTLHGVVFLGSFLVLNPAAAGCVLLMRLLLSIRFKHPLWSVLLHPAAEAFLLALGVSSWWRFRHGSGVEWKGRRYQAP